MSDEKLVNIARLMTTYNFEIEQFPDNLKCVQCGLVLKDACQVPCGCRLCRFCVNDMMARGRIFCPGVSKDCGESLLARFVSDYLANKKEEKEDLAGRVRILSEDIDREIVERNDSDEIVSARVINHVDKEIAAITWLIGSNKDEFVINIQSMRDDITSINQGFQSIQEDICSVKALVGLEQVDASVLWLIDVDLDKTSWYCGHKLSEYFFGEVHQYKYRLESYNFEINTALAELRIRLVIEAGPNDGQLTWPFEARVVITVTDRDRRETCMSISQQCEIDRPPDNDCRWSDRFKFLHSELRGAGLNLSRGVNVSCVIVPGGDG